MDVYLLIFLIVIVLVLFYYNHQQVESYVNYHNPDNYSEITQKIIQNIYSINLDRSPKRWHLIQKIGAEQGLKINRFPAVDGAQLDNIKDYCSDEYYKFAGPNLRGNVGCYLSHLNVLKSIIDNKIEYALIIEDDVILPPNFKQKLNQTVKQLPLNWDIVYLGITRPCGRLYKNNLYIPSFSECKRDNGGAFAYLVNYRSAIKIYRFINTKIIKMVDHRIRDYFGVLNVFIVYPLLIKHNFGLVSNRNGKLYGKQYVKKANTISLV